MIRALWSSRAAMNAQQEKLDSVSNNISNANTVGYKREDVSFQDLVYETLNRKGTPTGGNNTDTLINGTGVKATNWLRDTSQGSLKETGQNTDLALDGEGFFRVTLPDGSKAYERSGSFNIDSAGEIVDKNGNRLDVALTEEGANMLSSGTVLTTDNFAVKENGDVYLAVDNNGSKSSLLYGKINIYNPVGQNSLRSIGENLYVPSAGATVNITTDVSIMQGFVELSNVDMGKEMTDMIVAQRAFELSSRTLKTADEMWGLVNSMKGR
ncbi:flagellar basal-body rod protein FlgG [Clostridium magnum]|uniref:Flagellar basal-body rod protein FlgG n=1 Tax=Clostridium magnum DSM 2767 TaxID=1121326 RepID=A0A161Y724_9CLOT|nr:flagellar basal-body rod protein FlgG [Clostridium magnum]KZL94159.1 flagellar basal-body rod protein FlgG [Clostridium magnum DSM 2767]SHH93972.1 flagellar basal-body rod protein FlgG [Clostridium magnum DSM 2767]